MNFIIKLIASALGVLLVSYLLPGVKVDSIVTALIVAVILAFMNSIVKPLLVLLTLPVTILTLGLFLLVINAVIILITDRLVDGFSVANFWYALLFSIVLSLTNAILFKLIEKDDKK
jgi:putative membrane protein